MDTKNKPWFVIAVIFLCFSLKTHLSLAADRISGNQSLSGDQTIVSAREFFELGFFLPGNSSNYYLGIWYHYKQVSQQTVVWVANREKPVSDKYSSELRVSDGNLVLFNESKIPIWSTKLSATPSGSVEAQLLDSGNLVLRDGSNSSEPLWQSFDHPDNTWLPGGKMRYNKKTNESTLLISWKSVDDPALGLFSFQLDHSGKRYLSFYNRTREYYDTGSWNGRIFSLVPEVDSNSIYHFSYIDNENESYFIYTVYNTSIIFRFLMDFGGQIQQSWLRPSPEIFLPQPKDQCDVYAYCGAFGSCDTTAPPFCHCLTGFVPRMEDDWNSTVYSSGCVRRTSLQCGNSSLVNGKSDRFLPTNGINLPENSQTVTVGSAQECESNCFNNCSCTAYVYDGNQCAIWHGDILDLKQVDIDGKTIYIRLAASEFPSSSNNNGGIIIGAAVCSVGGVALLGLVLFVVLRRMRATKIGTSVEGTLVAFGYRQLQSATKNFSEKLGGGGFGSVFKGTLPDSTVIAVKKLESISQGEKQFRSEVSTIGTIQHINLVRLRGFCTEGTKKLLVYDYMPNGSLAAHLFHDKETKVLDWKTRYNIALGTARGLAYLHEKCRECIIHCDIKPDNILLDTDFCPKMADFGLAKLFGREFSRVLTTMRGTIGYLAPEWISGVAITTKADVYSYGMMLLEIVSGKRNYDQQRDGDLRYFPIWMATLINGGGDVFDLLDPRLQENAEVDPRLQENTGVEEVTRICRVACWCIQDDETQRPSMGQVVHILEGILEVSLPPIPRILQALGEFSSV